MYRSVESLLAFETLVLDDDGLLIRAHCHYTTGPAELPRICMTPSSVPFSGNGRGADE